MTIQMRRATSSTNRIWGDAMKKSHESKRSGSSGTTNEERDKFIPAREPEECKTTEQSSDQGRSQQSTRIWMSGLLIIGLFAIAVFAAPAASRAAEIAVGVSVRIGPPPLPVYVQPICPGPGYIWTPGYWAYDPDRGYFWVPGTWVMAPTVGFLWTPGYWGWGGAAFIWHAGYWGPHVGFYGGINYGFGYNGVGFVGGEWRGGNFFYNRSVNNFGRMHFANVYYRPVATNFAANRVSYNGGAGGLRARPTPGELAAQRDRHIEATSLQRQHEMVAHNDRAQFASVNHGSPHVAATGRPGEFRGASVVPSTRAGGAANPARYHSTNPGHANSYSGTHSPNPGVGGTHQVMTAHPNSTSPHSSGTRQARTAPGQFHSTSPNHKELSRGPTPSHQTTSHQGQPQQHSSRPSEGGRSEQHGNESHH